MAGVLTLDQYLGGPDKIITQQAFPSDQRTLVYNYQRDLTGWTFEADYQTIVVDLVQFNRFTGEPNFSKSKVIGSFAKVEIIGSMAPDVVNVSLGQVHVHFPANMYTGPIIPDARKNVPIVIYSLTWRDNSPVAQTQTHRWALIQAWEPDVPVGDPTLAAGYTAFA